MGFYSAMEGGVLLYAKIMLVLKYKGSQKQQTERETARDKEKRPRK